MNEAKQNGRPAPPLTLLCERLGLDEAETLLVMLRATRMSNRRLTRELASRNLSHAQLRKRVRTKVCAYQAGLKEADEVLTAAAWVFQEAKDAPRPCEAKRADRVTIYG